MDKLKRFLGSLHFLIVSILIFKSNGNVEFCSKSATDGIYWLNQSVCEFGILFPEPVMVDCLVGTNRGMKADVCNDTEVDTGSFPIMIQYISKNDAAEIEEEHSCNKPEKCGAQVLIDDINWTTKIVAPSIMHTNEAWPDAASGIVTDATVGNQTYRLFKHLMGFNNDDEGPVLRVVTLLKKSFQILGKFCSNQYVSQAFGEDILTAFLFLLGESDTSRIMDIGMEDYRKIDGALNDCLDQKMPFTFSGSTCKTYGYIETINTTKGLVNIVQDEYSWKADKYDIPVDVTWAAADFVHGLCYGTFKSHVNSHHLYQQAIERIFTREIVARWDKPMVLARQDLWDNFFSANVRNTIENLEYCVQAAYYDAPFLHRLERLLKHYDGPRSYIPTPRPRPVPRSPNSTVTPVPGAVTPEPGATTPDTGGATPDPGAATSAPGAATPAPGAATPDPGAATPDPGAATINPGAATPDPGAATPDPGAATPDPGAATPPGAVTSSGADTPTSDSTSPPSDLTTASSSNSDATITTPDEARRRKKRDAPMALPSMENLRFYCFKTEEERDTLLEKYKTTVCSN